MNKRSTKKLLTFFFLFLTAAMVGGNSRRVAAQQKRKPIELKLEHDALGKAPTLKVQIGRQTLPFLFDTGGGVTLITPELAREAGCEPFGKLTEHNAGGDLLEFKRCDDIELKIGDFTKRLDVAVMEVMSLFNPNTPSIGGFVTLQTFENEAITIDLAGNRLIVETEKSLAARVKGMNAMKSRLSTGSSGSTLIAFVAVNTPRGKIWMEFDSGNFGALQFSPHAQEMLGIDFDAANKAKIAKPVKLDLIGLRQIEMPGREREMIIDAMLNYDTISKMTVTIDLRSGKMWAKMNAQTTSK